MLVCAANPSRSALSLSTVTGSILSSILCSIVMQFLGIAILFVCACKSPTNCLEDRRITLGRKVVCWSR